MIEESFSELRGRLVAPTSMGLSMWSWWLPRGSWGSLQESIEPFPIYGEAGISLGVVLAPARAWQHHELGDSDRRFTVKLAVCHRVKMSRLRPSLCGASEIYYSATACERKVMWPSSQLTLIDGEAGSILRERQWHCKPPSGFHFGTGSRHDTDAHALRD